MHAMRYINAQSYASTLASVLREYPQIWYKCPLLLHELIGIQFPKVRCQSHCDLARHTT